MAQTSAHDFQRLCSPRDCISLRGEVPRSVAPAALHSKHHRFLPQHSLPLPIHTPVKLHTHHRSSRLIGKLAPGARPRGLLAHHPRLQQMVAHSRAVHRFPPRVLDLLPVVLINIKSKVQNSGRSDHDRR